MDTFVTKRKLEMEEESENDDSVDTKTEKCYSFCFIL
jgi:hypothetical protein